MNDRTPRPPAHEEPTGTTPPPAPKSDDMREADVSNGENPDGDQGAPERPTEDDASDAHLTGHRQAAINEENDPPG